MNTRRICSCLSVCLLWVLVTCWSSAALGASTGEDTFALLQIGTRMYTNVTVTTKSKDYIFILHSAGMTNFKVADLPLELREKLGYVVQSPKPQTNNAAVWAKERLAKIENSSAVKNVKSQVVSAWQSRAPDLKLAMPQISGRALYVVLAALVALYLFYCYCCSLICRKTGKEPGILVWIPVLQLLPLLRGAGMSGWWFLAYFVPVLNLVAHVLWCFNIARARGKNFLLGLLLLLPPTGWLAFLFLAFADSAPRASGSRKQDRRIEIMTLDAV